MIIQIKITVVGKVTDTWKGDDGTERPSYKVNYIQDNGIIIGQLKVSEEIYNSIEAGKEYSLSGTYNIGKNGGYVCITGISNPLKGGNI
ncbi:MAG: hypothetical protein IJV71_00995 [Lachnospiraceae bacterium]|nr:hypothetical protein [Lachnospiraceae bacterium]